MALTWEVEESHSMRPGVAEGLVAGYICESLTQLLHQSRRLMVLDAHQQILSVGEFEERFEHGTVIFSEDFRINSSFDKRENDTAKVSNWHQSVPSKDFELCVEPNPQWMARWEADSPCRVAPTI